MKNNFDELIEIVAPIAKKYSVERVSLFGSRARGDDSVDSDYDFCIMPGDKMSMIDLSNFFLDLKDALKSEIDIVCEDSINPKFAECIEKDKVLIYEIRQYSHRMMTNRTIRQRFCTEPILNQQNVPSP